MQVLKENLREKIIRSARKEFKKNGYKKTSMRTISNQAEMTVGNIYRYYKNKEELFEAIIRPLLDRLKNIMQEFQSKTPDIRSLMDICKNLQNQFRIEWVILFKGAKGTRYENIVKKLQQLFTDTLASALKRKKKHPELAKPITIAVFNGVNTILIDGNKETMNLAEDFIEYMLAGIS